MRRLALFVCLSVLFAASTTAALAQKRMALVIGNSAYANAPKLVLPAGNAQAIGTMFMTAGFDLVATHRDLDADDMRRAIQDFSDRAVDADIAVLYFSGHAIQVRDASYLFPIEARLDSEESAIPLDQVVTALRPARTLRVIILDVSRNDPFARDRGPPAGPVARGEPLPPNTLIAYAAKAGSPAVGGDGPHSPFTAALLKHLLTPGLDIRIALGRVRDETVAATNGKQEPSVAGSIGGVITLMPAGGLRRPADGDAQKRDYDLAAMIGTRAAWDAFLRTYPAGFYSELARAQRAKLDLPGAPVPQGIKQALDSEPGMTADEAACLDVCVVEWLGMNTCVAVGNVCVQAAAQACRDRMKAVPGICQRAAGSQ